MSPGARGRILVALQAIVMAAIAWLAWGARPWGPATQVGLVLALGLLAWSIWALGPALRPDPAPNHRGLRTGGPYRWIRHPIYGALALGSVSLIGEGRWFAPLTGLFLAVLAAKMRVEESLLEQAYPEYARYRSRTWRLLPGIW